MGAFEMTIQDTITFLLTFSGLSSALTVAHLHFAPSKGRWWRHDIPVRRRGPASLPGGD